MKVNESLYKLLYKVKKWHNFFNTWRILLQIDFWGEYIRLNYYLISYLYTNPYDTQHRVKFVRHFLFVRILHVNNLWKWMKVYINCYRKWKNGITFLILDEFCYKLISEENIYFRMIIKFHIYIPIRTTRNIE